MKKITLLAAFVMALFVLAGCQASVNTIENADKHATPNLVNDVRFVTDGFLRDRLVLQSVKMSPSAGGNMMVEVAATNVRTGVLSQAWSGMTGENPYPVTYKFTWQDANGMTVDTPLSIWKTARIIPGETVYFRAVAPTPQCKDFILSVKEYK